MSRDHIETIHALAREQYENQSTVSRRDVIRGGVAAGVGVAGIAATSTPAAAQVSGTFPDSGSDALLKTRADRLRLVERSGAPTAPSSGRVSLYTDGSDL